MAVPRVVQLQYQASISCNRSGCQRSFYRRIIRKAFVGVRFCSYNGICRFCECLCLFRSVVGSIEALQIMLYLIFRIRIRYRASFYRHVAVRHLEVFLLAPAAEVVACRYLGRWPYRHVAVVFIGLRNSVLHAVKHIGHVIAVDGECSGDCDVLGSHLIRQRAVPAIERIAFLLRPIPQRVDVLAVLVGLYLSMLFTVHEVRHRVLIPRVVQLQHELAVSCYRPFRHVLLGLLVICEPCERPLVRRRQRIRLSGQILCQPYRIFPVQAFQVVLYLILRISVCRERSAYLHVLIRHRERFRLAPAAERVARCGCRLCDAYLCTVLIRSFLR